MTIEQLNRTELDPPSFRLYVALLCENDMSVNKLAQKTGMTRRTISKKLPLLLDKDLAEKTNSLSKVPTYSGIGLTEQADSTDELKGASIGESFNPSDELNSEVHDDFDGELGGIWEKYS